jgi:uncharacterized membrane-anchored protein
LNRLPPDHPSRLEIADEVHARPPEPLDTPSRATYVAALIKFEDRDLERAHIAALCNHYGVSPPSPVATHFSTQLGEVRFKWERHGEFSGFTLVVRGLSPRPFGESAVDLLPTGWLAGLPGSTVVAAHAQLMPSGDAPLDASALAALFDGNLVVGGEIGEGAGHAYTDFRIHPDGFGRFVVCNRSFTERQAGRTLQRLFEIEVYRMLALLALPIARELTPRIMRIEQSLAELTVQISREGVDDEALLQELTRLAAEIESAWSTSQFRFAACRAYYQLVTTRIDELRESRLAGIQPITEFMARRLSPAVATCATASQRLRELSERVSQTSALLSTRVDIARERQNQLLLSSMDLRARMQLRLQQTVEGLSVAAIVYYVAGLLGYLAKAAKAGGAPLNPDLAVGLAIPAACVAVIWTLRRARGKLDDGAESGHF